MGEAAPARVLRVLVEEAAQGSVRWLRESPVPVRPVVKREAAGEEEKEEADSLPCRRCGKTFSNPRALANHSKLQHASLPGEGELEGKEGSAGEGQAPSPSLSSPPPLTLGEQLKRMSDAGNFRFVPREPGAAVRQRAAGAGGAMAGSLVSLVSEDVSYIIVKSEGETGEAEPSKRARRAAGAREGREGPGARREAPRAARAPVELSGPFECLQPSSYQPQGVCHQMFFNCCEYSMHYREEHTKRRKAALRCQVCEKRLDGCVSERASGGRRAFLCTLCGVAFPDSTALEEHARALHTKAKPFRCHICHKRFTQQGGLQQHLRMHTGDRPYPCTYCEKAFTQKAGLEQHLRTHTKIKPFRCVVCDKSFSQSVHLRQHMRTHTNIQPFECGACGRRFKQSSHLNFHLKSHQTDGQHTAAAADAAEAEAEEEAEEDPLEWPGEGEAQHEVTLGPAGEALS